MTSANLDNLAKIGQLKKEPPDQAELEGLLQAGRNKLKDARNLSNTFESRFDLAYNAAHALSLAALRWHGYRSENRYIVFQVLPHTLALEEEEWRVLATCHERRNRAEYRGILEADERLLAAAVQIATRLLAAVEALGPVKGQIQAAATLPRTVRGTVHLQALERHICLFVSKLRLPETVLRSVQSIGRCG